MQTSFFSRLRWRIVGWVTAALFIVLFVYTLDQLRITVIGGA